MAESKEAVLFIPQWAKNDSSNGLYVLRSLPHPEDVFVEPGTLERLKRFQRFKADFEVWTSGELDRSLEASAQVYASVKREAESRKDILNFRQQDFEKELAKVRQEMKQAQDEAEVLRRELQALRGQ